MICPADDETGEAEDEDTAADDRKTEIVEHHGPGLHQVPHQHGEDLVSERVADDEGRTDLAGHCDLLLSPKKTRGEDGGHPHETVPASSTSLSSLSSS